MDVSGRRTDLYFCKTYAMIDNQNEEIIWKSSNTKRVYFAYDENSDYDWNCLAVVARSRKHAFDIVLSEDFFWWNWYYETKRDMKKAGQSLRRKREIKDIKSDYGIMDSKEALRLCIYVNADDICDWCWKDRNLNCEDWVNCLCCDCL